MMKTSVQATISLIACAGLLRLTLLDAQAIPPQGSAGSGGSTQACEAPRAAFQRVLARADSIFAGVGSQAAILRNGELVMTVENGWSDLEHRVPVTVDTKFQVASVTKAFTGLALLKLWEEGRIDLDRSVQAYVPTFPEKQGVITARLLAAHLGGVRHYQEEERTANFLFTHYYRIADALTLFGDDPLAAAPGTRFIYSSYGYNLLAAVIGGASGVEFDEHVRRVIIEPLGLTTTQFDNTLRPVTGRARGYTYYYPWYSRSADSLILQVPAFDYSYNVGGGNILSTARDLVYVGRAAIHTGLLAPASISLLSKPIQPDKSRWSFGWVIDDTAERLRLVSEGSVPGFQATIVAYPAEDLVVAYLQNSWGRWPADPGAAPDPLRELVALCLEGDRTR